MGDKTENAAAGATPRPSRRRVILCLGAAVAGCSRAPDLAPGEEGRVARISDGDLLALDTGQRVRLVEIEAPSLGFRERAAEPWAEEARAALAVAATGRRVKLFYGGLSRDRYDRALAHVIASDETGGDIWLNGYMIRQGAARARTYPDNARRARQLLTLEAEARADSKGLWALPHYRVRSHDDLVDAPYHAVVEGALIQLGEADSDAVLEVGRDGFSLLASPRLGPVDPALKLQVGQRIRARGRVDMRGDKPRIRITHWAQLETPDD